MGLRLVQLLLQRRDLLVRVVERHTLVQDCVVQFVDVIDQILSRFLIKVVQHTRRLFVKNLTKVKTGQ